MLEYSVSPKYLRPVLSIDLSSQYRPCAYMSCIVSVDEVLSKAFVECHRGSLGAAIFGISCYRHKARRTRDGDHVSMVVCSHVRNKLFDENEASNGAHGEDLLYLVLAH